MATLKAKPQTQQEHHKRTIKCATSLLVFLGDRDGELYNDIKDMLGTGILGTRFAQVVKNLKTQIETPYENK